MTAVMNMDEELELILERVVATVHAKHGRTAEQLAVVMRVSDDDMFDHLSELVISSRIGMVDACYYPIGATPTGIAGGRAADTSRSAPRTPRPGSDRPRRAKAPPTIVTYNRRA